MKLVVQVKLLPTLEQAAALAATLPACNALADQVSKTAYEKKVFSRVGLQKLTYTRLKAAGSRSAARRLARRRAREGRHAANVNHKISKEIVADAQRTGRGIALEELSGIRDRVRLRRHQRATISTWPFHRLGTFIAYKARRAGVPVIEVDAHYTSQTCPRCGHRERANRRVRDHFRCRRCGLAGPADHIAAVNVRRRARTAWVFVSMPAPPPDQGKGDATPTRRPVAEGSATRRERPGRRLGRSRPRS
ncbi:transposase [Spirillospora sp. NPDC029432]|uniref:transposase n=1 Tax=Spirillospora sp. NPDC029432 TaxID=3154599 RepID=UPI003456ADB1